jgi:hypothetical protein
MWDAKDRLDADMQYAIRMIQMNYATVAQAAAMCGVEEGALQAYLSNLQSRVQVVQPEKPSYALDRHIPGAY